MPDLVNKAWSAFGAMENLGQVSAALQSTMTSLRSWSNRRFGNVTREINKSRSQLEELMHMNADRQEIRKVSDKLNELMYKEEMLWLQRSRIMWLKEGDRNTKFFQSKSVWRARKNRIKELHDAAGNVYTDTDTMSNMATSYFKEIFTAAPSLEASGVVDLVNMVITDNDNDKLCAEFTDQEISDALFQIGPL